MVTLKEGRCSTWSVSLLICIAVVLSDSGGIQTHDL